MISDTNEFTIGSDVSCRDGQCGKLTRVVIDPIDKALTHLVVQPAHRDRMGRLVPVALVDSAGEEIWLGCTTAQFDALQEAEETQFLPGAGGQWGYHQDQMLSWPYYGIGTGGMGAGMGGADLAASPHAVTYDHVPQGEVEVKRGEHVHATDGDIGRVQGLAVDPGNHHVTHVLLDEGHLWGRRRVAIPITAVGDVKDGVRLTLTRNEVRDLPAIDLDHRD
jgi:hypothetical protein